MEYEIFLRWIHVIGACVLLGTGAGIAFFMLMAHRSGNALVISHTAKIVVLTDFLFTTSAVVVQPLSGILLAIEIGWSLFQGWVFVSLVLYIVVGFCWLPVVWIQIQLRKEADLAVKKGEGLSVRYHRLFKIWFALGIPAFILVITIVWLMIAKPSFELGLY